MRNLCGIDAEQGQEEDQRGHDHETAAYPEQSAGETRPRSGKKQCADSQSIVRDVAHGLIP